MNIDTYQTLAMTYRLPTADGLYALLNLAAEAGEVAGLAAKRRRDGGDIEQYNKALAKELGDVLWMVAAVAADNRLSLSGICQDNLAKLDSRKQRDKIQGSGDDR
jgi:NTP pyrophosphatase (non-canonical NTP hydrolase)